MQMITLPVKGYWVICREDEYFNEEFGAGQFEEAISYMNEQRRTCLDKKLEIIAEIDA